MKKHSSLMLKVAGLVLMLALWLNPKTPAILSGLKNQAAGLLPAAATPLQQYTVQPGDTPLGVALMFSTSVAELVRLNRAAHPEIAESPMHFNAGWRISVPARVGPAAATAPPAGSSAGGTFDEAGALELIRLTNDARAASGLGPLAEDGDLMAIARKRAVEIVSDWGHQGITDDCADCGENIVKGPGGPQSDLDWWLNSPDHRRNVLFSGYTRIGTARYVIGRRVYSVQIFHQ